MLLSISIALAHESTRPDHRHASAIAVSDCGSQGLDGEGCAEITNLSQVVVGSDSVIKLKFTVGATGIPIGGGISIGFHHGAKWKVQVTNPSADGYIAVAAPHNTNLSLVSQNYTPIGMFKNPKAGLFDDSIFHNVVIAKVTEKALLAGDVVEFTIGANSQKTRIQKYTDIDHELRITTDVDGDGVYKGIASSPVFDIKHAPAHSLSASLPSQSVKNTANDITIRVEDQYYNLVENYDGVVQVKDENGVIVHAGVEIKSGIGKSKITISTTGAHRLRLKSIDQLLTGRSNPTRVMESLPDTRLFWADLHGHTGVSDGLGEDAIEYFTFGRDVAALDVIALTDHGHFAWEANIEAVQRFHNPGKYVTLLAQEAGAGQDHMNLYYRLDDEAHISQWQNNYQNFLDWTSNQFNSDTSSPRAMTAPHHFSYNRGDPEYPFGAWDNRIARFVEVYSSHGTNEYPDNPRPLRNPASDFSKYMQGGLESGKRFGVIGASDNHDSKPGRSSWGIYPGGLAGIWATDLTRDSIWSSLWNYKTYATSADRIYLEVFIDGHPMGSEFETTGSVKIEAYIIGKTDSLSAVLIKNNQKIASYESSNGVIEIDLQEDPGVGEHFYYIRVTQDNGERAWSTPIWVSADETPKKPQQGQTEPKLKIATGTGCALTPSEANSRSIDPILPILNLVAMIGLVFRKRDSFLETMRVASLASTRDPAA